MNVVRQDLEVILMGVSNPLELDPVKVALRLNERPAAVKGRWLWPNREMLELVGRLQEEPLQGGGQAEKA